MSVATAPDAAERRPAAKPRGHHFSLRLALITSCLIGLTCALLGYLLVGRHVDAIHTSLVDRARVITELLVREAELSVLSGNVAALRQLAGIAMDQPDVVYCRFFDESGVLLAAVGEVPASAPSGPIAQATAPIEVESALWEFQAPIHTAAQGRRGEELAFP